MAPQFHHLCDDSNTITTRLHAFRVGSDGSSSDIVIREWNYTDSKVYAPTPGDPYDFTRVQSAPALQVGSNAPIITNADTGALVGWTVVGGHYCPLETHAGCVSHVTVNTEHHLTTTAGSSVASDVIWGSPIRPVLQLEDGSFVGYKDTSTLTMVAFDSSGNTKWSVQAITPPWSRRTEV